MVKPKPTSEELFKLADTIEERHERNKTATTSVQRVHAKDVPSVTSALRFWAGKMIEEELS